jgi:hypothetical protein
MAWFLKRPHLALQNIWMAVLFVLISMEDKVNRLLRADNTAVEELKTKMANLEAERARIPTGVDMMNIACVGYVAIFDHHLCSKSFDHCHGYIAYVGYVVCYSVIICARKSFDHRVYNGIQVLPGLVMQ